MPLPCAETTVLFQQIIRDAVDDRALYRFQRLHQMPNQTKVDLGGGIVMPVDLCQQPLDPLDKVLCRHQLLIALDTHGMCGGRTRIISGSLFWSAFAHVLNLYNS